MDIICQAKSGMGKTAVFVLAVLQQLVPVENTVDTLVLCHTRELAYQICQEFLRFRSAFLPPSLHQHHTTSPLPPPHERQAPRILRVASSPFIFLLPLSQQVPQ